MEKISKEDWLKLTKEEQDYLTLEFNKSVEKRRVLTILATRLIAIACVCALIWIGFVQYSAINGYNRVMTDYGALGFCYLCGEQTLRQCTCQYSLGSQEIDILEVANRTAWNNIQPCEVKINEKPLWDFNASNLKPIN